MLVINAKWKIYWLVFGYFSIEYMWPDFEKPTTFGISRNADFKY